MAPTSTPPEIAERLMRAPLLGTMFAMLLYGIISLQSHLYFQHYPKDPWYIKTIVGIIWVLETIQVALAIYFIDIYLIQNFGSVETLTMMEWSLGVTAIFGFVIGWMVNIFFVWRIWLLSKSEWVTGVIGALATTRAALGITATSFGKPFPKWHDFVRHADPFILSGLSLGVVVDCLITLAVSRQLIHGRSGARSTDVLINRLLGYTLNTGLITSLFAIIEIITYRALPTTLVFLAFVFVQSKLYANCLLATLNARRDLRARLPAVNISTGSAARFSKWSVFSKSMSQGQTVDTTDTTDTVTQKETPTMTAQIPLDNTVSITSGEFVDDKRHSLASPV